MKTVIFWSGGGTNPNTMIFYVNDWEEKFATSAYHVHIFFIYGRKQLPKKSIFLLQSELYFKDEILCSYKYGSAIFL